MYMMQCKQRNLINIFIYRHCEPFFRKLWQLRMFMWFICVYTVDVVCSYLNNENVKWENTMSAFVILSDIKVTDQYSLVVQLCIMVSLVFVWILDVCMKPWFCSVSLPTVKEAPKVNTGKGFFSFSFHSSLLSFEQFPKPHYINLNLYGAKSHS